jgi:hypothetical protein
VRATVLLILKDIVASFLVSSLFSPIAGRSSGQLPVVSLTWRLRAESRKASFSGVLLILKDIVASFLVSSLFSPSSFYI